MADYNLKEIFELTQKIDEEFKQLAKSADAVHASLKKIGDSATVKKLNESIKELNKNQEQYNKTRKMSNDAAKKASTINKRAIREADKITQSLDLELQTRRQLVRLKQREIQQKAKLLAEEKKFGRVQKNSIEDLKRQQKELSQLRNRVTQGSAAYKKYTDRLRDVNTQLRKTGDEIKDNRANVGNYTGALNKGIGALKNYAKGFLAVGAAIGALRRISQAAQEYIQLARDQIIVEQKLSTVLKERTNASEEQVQSILNLTAAQQQLGVIGDEVQIAGAQQLATFVNSTDAVKTLLPQLNNLLAQQKGLNASQGDAVNIGNLLGKALQGQVGALSRVGISFNEAQSEILKTGNEMERTAVLAEVIQQNVGNMNAELAKTDVGRIQQLENQMGDLKEEIGKELIPIMKAFKSVSVGSFKAILDLTKDLTEPIDLINDLAKSFKRADSEQSKFQKALPEVSKNLRILINPLIALIKWTSLLIKGLREALVFFGVLESEQAKRAGNIRARIDELTASFLALDAAAKSKVKKSFDELSARFARGEINALQFANELNKLIISAQGATNPINDLTESIEENADASDKATENIGRFSESVENNLTAGLKSGASEMQEFKGVVTDTIIGTEAELSKFDKYIQGVFGSEEGTLLGRIFGGGKEGDAIAAATIELYSAVWNLINQQTQQEIQRLDELIGKQEQSIKKTEDQIEGELNRLNELKTAGQAFDQSRINSLNKQLANEKRVLAEGEKAQKAAKEKQKRQAIIQANIDIAGGIVKAIASSPPPSPLGLIGAALVAALGAIQLVTIKNQKFAKGGWIEGPSHAQGGVDITREAEGGEFMVRKQFAPGSANLLEMINKGLINDNNIRGLQQKSSVYINNNGEVVNRLDKIVDNTSQKEIRDANGKLKTKFFNNHTINYN
jgi:DNA repair exonuclease SbcCD ATPase subunit